MDGAVAPAGSIRVLQNFLKLESRSVRTCFSSGVCRFWLARETMTLRKKKKKTLESGENSRDFQMLLMFILFFDRSASNSIPQRTLAAAA